MTAALDDPNDVHFRRRVKAAQAGRHFPTLDELVRGCPFMGLSMETDAQAFAERLLERLPEDGGDGSEELRASLEGLTLSPRADDFRRAYSALLALYVEKKRASPFDEFDFLDLDAPVEKKRRWLRKSKKRIAHEDEHALRCAFYAASSGCRESAWLVAAPSLACFATSPDRLKPQYGAAAMGWLAVSAPVVPTAEKRMRRWVYSTQPGQALVFGSELLSQISPPSNAVPPPAKVQPVSPPQSRHPMDDADVSEPPEQPEPEDGVVVFTGFGNADTGEGKKLLPQYTELIGTKLPRLPKPDLAVVRRELLAQFPYAATVVDLVLNDLAPRSHVMFRPTVLVGDPGGGKTTFAGELLRLLGAQHEVYSCGGVSDPALTGTPRRWSTGEPSLPVALVRRWKTASPGIVLDEVEKCGTGRHNGNLLDGLLGLLEPRSASAWHDPFVEAPCDLSHVLWLGTANSLEGLPSPLRDRCRIIRFPNPRPVDLQALAPVLLKQAVASQGLDPRWAQPLDGAELDALRDSWPGGSVRRLQRLVEGVLAVRGKYEGGFH